MSLLFMYLRVRCLVLSRCTLNYLRKYLRICPVYCRIEVAPISISVRDDGYRHVSSAGDQSYLSSSSSTSCLLQVLRPFKASTRTFRITSISTSINRPMIAEYVLIRYELKHLRRLHRVV